VLGDEGWGITGLDTSATLLTTIAARYGVTAESPVTVRSGAPRAAAAPESIADRIDRVPEGDSQVRIDRYEFPGQPDRFEVYIGGTIDFSPTATDEPWDMTSNVRGVAGLPAGSIDAVRTAMTDAGVTPDTPVVFTGYSQGGLVAARLAASGDYTAAGLVTVGAPAGQVLLPEGMPAIVIEHTDDIVPATGGLQINRGAVVVERELFAGVDPPSDFAVPAHQLAEYRDTARLVDAAGDPRVVGAAAAIAAVTAGAAAGASVSYRAERVQKG
jgi:pimeloyl-ACP methyl ester carboxylesterase